ncbi:alpha-galactosidase [Mucilaginibacter oryzae]|uniref:Alpha-galactosidase n=2 Tax=Mucilaginibacter oryzae TaxID=468058 RepID=A0A316HW20_9SPHI|nr:alpha-galactosidase [Mucilaginibacter oryzae]
MNQFKRKLTHSNTAITLTMQRRHFLKLSATTAAALLFSKLTHAIDNGASLINSPDEIWIQSGSEWVKLSASNGSRYTYREIAVSLKANGGALGIYASSPKQELNAIRLKWKHTTSASANFLGDHWERSYGDLQWKSIPAGIKNPWYVIIHDDKQTACFGVKTGANSICWWGVNDDSIELTLDTTSGGVGVLLGDRQLHAADVITTNAQTGEDPFMTTHRFCKMMCDKPRLPKQPVYGINDWYFAYGNNSSDLIRKTTAMMAELVTDHSNKPFSVIDAGWATYSPLLPGDGGWNDDFSKPNDKFKDMHALGDDIKKMGMRPGLWMRPLCARHDEKASLLAPKIPGRDDPKNPTLDPTIPENIAHIQHNFDVYKQWGYEMVKHDFSTYDIAGRWGFDMNNSFTSPGWHFNDRSKTNAEIILGLYRAIRQAAGENIYVIGCNTMSHLSAGIFELCRIGDDTSGNEWERTRKMGVNTLAFRLPQHNAFYAVDGDCVGITTKIEWKRNKQWLQLLAESGAPLFVSGQPEAMGEEQKKAVKTAFAQAAKVQPLGKPLDWMETLTPSKWKLNNRVVDFDWS